MPDILDVDQFKWKKRIILVFTDLPSEEACAWQIRALSERKNELSDRDLLILKVNQKNKALDPLTGKQYDLKSDFYSMYESEYGAFGLILIGKDGGIKLNSKKPIEPQIIFSLIDGMPMRQAEMRKSP